MAVFRVERIKDYTVMSNHHLRNKNLSLKAKGLLSQMLSLPDDWDYTLKGLAAINKESVDAIRTAIWELEDAGYVVRTRVRDERGCLRGCDYYVYEYPQTLSSGSGSSAESVPPMLEPLALKFGGTFMKMLYTANSRYIRCCTEEGTRPVIIVCEKEYEVDVQEFMLWSILNWRILREEEIGSYYEKMASNSNVTIHRSWQDCVQRLLVRGLIVAGTGDTEYDALYDLLACRFIIPIGAAWPLRVLSFLKLTFLEGISWRITRRLFHVDARSACEKKVIRLARQTPLSCAEIIKCIEMDIRRLKDGYDVLDKLYDDNDLNCDNFAQAVREYRCSCEVITAVANLYLRQQIMLDTY